MAKLSLVLLLVLSAAAPWSVAGYMSKFKAANACAAGHSGAGCENNKQLQAAYIAKSALNTEDWADEDEGLSLLQKTAVMKKGRKRVNSELSSPQEDVEDTAVQSDTSVKDKAQPVELAEDTAHSDFETSVDGSESLPSAAKEADVEEHDSSKALAEQLELDKERQLELESDSSNALASQLELEKDAGNAAVETLIQDQENAGNKVVSEPSVASLMQAAAQAVVSDGEDAADADAVLASKSEAANRELDDVVTEGNDITDDDLLEDEKALKAAERGLQAIEEPNHAWVDHAPLQDLDVEPEI